MIYRVSWGKNREFGYGKCVGEWITLKVCSSSFTLSLFRLKTGNANEGIVRYGLVEAKTNVKSMLSSKDVWPSIHKYGQAVSRPLTTVWYRFRTRVIETTSYRFTDSLVERFGD